MHSSRSDVVAIDPSIASSFVSGIQLELYTQVALATLMVYDTITTLDKEVKYFWSAPRKLVSLIYFANRYIGLFAAIVGIGLFTSRASITLCLFSFFTEILANCITVLLIDYILLLRVLALYSKSKKLAIGLGVLFALEACLGLGILIYCLVYARIVVATLADGVDFCATMRSSPLLLATLSWGVPLAFELILMALALYKAGTFWRESAGFGGYRLVRVLIQDQVLYFLLIALFSVTRIVASQLGVDETLLAQLLVTFGSSSVLCVIGSRLLVHLKDAGERGLNEGTSYRLVTMSDVEFS